MKKRVPFGFEKGSGRPVEIEVSHLAVVGITRASGKTTILRALAERSGARVLTFEVKPQESTDFLQYGHQIPIFYTGAVDALTLKETLERRSRMGLKKEFPALIQAAEGAKDIHEVLWAVRKKLEPPPPPAEGEKPKRLHPVEKNSLLIVESLLSGLMDEIIKSNPSNRLELQRGLNVMDLRGLSDEYQQLIIKSVADRLYESETNVVLAMDEAHKFLPEHQPSACKQSVIRLIKEGGSRKLWVWMSTQALTALSKQALKQVSTWVLGRQMELLEVERTIAQVPVSRHLRPRPEVVMSLGVGYFIVASGESVVHAYAWPGWLSEWGAREHSRRGYTALPPPQPSSPPVAQGA